MEKTVELSETKPFHESIVEAISMASSRDMECLATLIKATKIPKGHDNIAAAWNKRRKEMCWGNEDLGVLKALHNQKVVAERKQRIAVTKTFPVNPNENIACDYGDDD